MNHFTTRLLERKFVALLLASLLPLALQSAARAGTVEDHVFRNPTPPKPKMVEVRGADNALLGGIFEMIKDPLHANRPGVYVTNAHVIEGHTAAEVRASFAAAHLNVDEFQFYRVRKGLKDLDLLMIVPKGRESLFLEKPSPSAQHDCDAETVSYANWKVRPIRSEDFPSNVHEGANYYSYQYGKMGTADIVQVSSGRITATELTLDRTHFYLPPGLTNNTTARSSGSPVYVKVNSFRGTRWKLGGIVECEYPAKETDELSKGLPKSGMTRVISFSSLAGADVRQIPIAIALRPQPRGANGCIPIDGRGGGGGK